MNTPTKLQKAGYKGVKVTSMLNALKSKEIHKHLRLVQQNELAICKNKYEKNGYLNKQYFQFIWCLYWNFVLNDFRFTDKNKVATIPSKQQQIEAKHIGLKMFEDLKKEEIKN